MRVIRIISLLVLFTAVLNLANGQSNGLTREHKMLADIVGSWTIKGMEDRFLEICEFYKGGYFLVCNSEFKSKSGKLNNGVSIMGYSTEGKHLTYYHYGSSGESQTLKGRIDENGTLFFEGDEMIKGKLTKTRVEMKKAGENYDFKEETSVDNGPWTTSTEIVYVRLK